jgi:hypothetical protein
MVSSGSWTSYPLSNSRRSDCCPPSCETEQGLSHIMLHIEPHWFSKRNNFLINSSNIFKSLKSLLNYWSKRFLGSIQAAYWSRAMLHYALYSLEASKILNCVLPNSFRIISSSSDIALWHSWKTFLSYILLKLLLAYWSISWIKCVVLGSINNTLKKRNLTQRRRKFRIMGRLIIQEKISLSIILLLVR